MDAGFAAVNVVSVNTADKCPNKKTLSWTQSLKLQKCINISSNTFEISKSKSILLIRTQMSKVHGRASKTLVRYTAFFNRTYMPKLWPRRARNRWNYFQFRNVKQNINKTKQIQTSSIKVFNISNDSLIVWWTNMQMKT